MIGYFTHNNVSQSVMKVFKRAGYEVRDIGKFDPSKPAIFYGILRGTGAAMRVCQAIGQDFYYVDNGYYDAVYMDVHKRKDMTGKYRVVKNDMAEVYTGPVDIIPAKPGMSVLLLPPSPYTAFMYDTTPEDWNFKWVTKLGKLGYKVEIRGKDVQTPLQENIKRHDAVFAFNSMSVMTAIDMGRMAYDTHGILRNSDLLERGEATIFDIEAVKNFYADKNFTLSEIAEGKVCLSL